MESGSVDRTFLRLSIVGSSPKANILLKKSNKNKVALAGPFKLMR